MKKRVIILLAIMIAIIVLALFIKTDKKIATTDLSDITIEGLQIGEEVKLDSLSKYTDASRKYSDEFKYKFEEMLIDVDDENRISFIQGIEGKAEILVKGEPIVNIEEVERIFGSEYIDKTYDYGQSLYEYVYKDNEKKQVAQFVYAPNGKLCWVTVSEEAYYVE